MRILLLAAASSIHTVRWANALFDLGHEVMLAYLYNHENRNQELREGVRLLRLPVSGTKGYYLNAPALRRAAKEFEPDVVNAHYASGYGTLMRMAGLCHMVLSVWGSDVYDFPYQSRIQMRIVRKNLNYADRIASTSHCMAAQVCKLLGRQEQIYVTPFGVDTCAFSPGAKREPSGGICIGNVKTLAPKYGIDCTIRAVRLLLDDLREDPAGRSIADSIRCRIYGEGPQRQELERLIAELRLENVVTLEGAVSHDRVPEVLREMDIFCVNSLLDSESFGVSAVEAASAGLPVVVSDADGLREVTEDGVTGIVVPRNDPEKTAAALKKLVLDRQLREQMGAAGRKRVETLYDWDCNVQELIRVYQTLVK